jgi:hypothetical protein
LRRRYHPSFATYQSTVSLGLHARPELGVEQDLPHGAQQGRDEERGHEDDGGLADSELARQQTGKPWSGELRALGRHDDAQWLQKLGGLRGSHQFALG